MIRKLKRKFILINMILVTLVLLIVFGALCLSEYQRLNKESYDAMLRAVELKPGLDAHKPQIGGAPTDRMPPLSAVPVICVLIDKNSAVTDILSDNAAISDVILDAAVKKALASDADAGVLADEGLRYLKRSTPDGQKIAFADMGYERAAMTTLIGSSLLIGLGALAAFFIISLFLSALALRPVEKAWVQQRRFIADASHELKTPLTVILANTGILITHRQDTIEKQFKWVEYIQTEANRMKRLVEELLFLAKSDTARTPALKTPLNLSDVIWRSLLPFESVAFEQGITLHTDIAENIGFTGDESQLNQLLMILLDNACKYAGDKGVVTVTLALASDKIKLSVHNTGAPIPKDHLPRLFERFYRVDESRVRTKGGYGLGLAIAESIVKNHNGRITVESTAQKGTAFTVLLPVR